MQSRRPAARGRPRGAGAPEAATKRAGTREEDAKAKRRAEARRARTSRRQTNKCAQPPTDRAPASGDEDGRRRAARPRSPKKPPITPSHCDRREQGPERSAPARPTGAGGQRAGRAKRGAPTPKGAKHRHCLKKRRKGNANVRRPQTKANKKKILKNRRSSVRQPTIKVRPLGRDRSPRRPLGSRGLLLRRKR